MKPVAYAICITPEYFTNNIQCKNVWAKRTDGLLQFKVSPESIKEVLAHHNLETIRANNGGVNLVARGTTQPVGALLELYSWDDEKYALLPKDIK